MTQPHFWRKEQRDFLLDIYEGKTRNEIVALIKEQFGLDLTVTQISNELKRNGIKMGRQLPSTTLPVGSERNIKGYLCVKVCEGKPYGENWIPKHTLLWEETHGRIPEKHCLLFLDGDKSNITLDNLRLITREQLAILNKKQMLSKERGLNEAAVNVAKVFSKINEINRRETK